jgi:hypothetical protein
MGVDVNSDVEKGSDAIYAGSAPPPYNDSAHPEADHEKATFKITVKKVTTGGETGAIVEETSQKARSATSSQNTENEEVVEENQGQGSATQGPKEHAQEPARSGSEDLSKTQKGQKNMLEKKKRNNLENVKNVSTPQDIEDSPQSVDSNSKTQSYVKKGQDKSNGNTTQGKVTQANNNATPTSQDAQANNDAAASSPSVSSQAKNTSVAQGVSTRAKNTARVTAQAKNTATPPSKGPKTFAKTNRNNQPVGLHRKSSNNKDGVSNGNPCKPGKTNTKTGKKVFVETNVLHENEDFGQKKTGK